jgi:anti-sigma regulatory factor (Ser/Thr protein kinase)
MAGSPGSRMAGTPAAAIDLAADRHALVAAQQQLEEFLVRHRVEPALRLRAAVVFEEAFMNVLMHAYDEPAGQPLQAFVSLPPGALVLQLEDHGRPFDPTVSAVAPADPSAGPLGGRGLALIRKLAQRVERERLGPVNRLTMQLLRD